MPQMAPMNWLLLMFYFSIIFIMINNMNYYSFNYKIMTSKINYFKKIKKNWKW